MIASSSAIDQPTKQELVKIWHQQRCWWVSREEAEEDFDLYLSLSISNARAMAGKSRSSPSGQGD